MKLKASHGRVADTMNISEEMEKTLVDELSKSIDKEILKKIAYDKIKNRLQSIEKIIDYNDRRSSC
jgi:glutamine cyclotransferase